MKKILIICFIFILIILFGYKILMQKNIEEESVEIVELQGKVALYFKGKEAMKLEKEYRNVSMERIRKNIAKTIVEELLKGPISEDFYRVIPEDAKLLGVEIEGSVAKINLSAEFVTKQEGEANALLAVYSIVNSLTEITEIESVKFMIEGVEEPTFKDYFAFDKPFERSIE